MWLSERASKPVSEGSRSTLFKLGYDSLTNTYNSVCVWGPCLRSSGWWMYHPSQGIEVEVLDTDGNVRLEEEVEMEECGG